jgi:hypothetical protein
VLAAAVVLAAAAVTGGVVAMSGGGHATPAAQEPLVNTATVERGKPAYSNAGAGGNKNVTGRPERSPEQQSEALEFAKCIRENGVKDFPDPVNGEHLVDTTRIPSSGTPGGMSILRAAMQKCAVTSWERQWGG